MRKAGGLEEASEGSDVPDEPFHLDFFSQVERRVGAKHVLGRGRFKHEGNQADLEGAREIEAFPELSGHVGMQSSENGASRHQIRAGALELACTGPGEDEVTLLLCLDKGMNDREKLGHFCTSSMTMWRAAGLPSTKPRRRSGWAL